MDEARLKEIERVCTERGCQPGRDQCREVCDEVRRLQGCLAIMKDGYDTAYQEVERLRAGLDTALVKLGEQCVECERRSARVSELEGLLECVPAESLPSDYVRWVR